MTTPQEPRDVPANSDSSPLPKDVERDAVPAQFRLAPRFARVIGTGAVLGAVAGIVIAVVLPNSTGVGTFTVALLMGAGLALMGGLVAGVIAVGMDRGTVRDYKAHRDASGDAADSSTSD
ncbi:hypothetical protein ON058_00750 [Demequina sp. B12]|uniref:hypothetical protein n=1 Tax=Demequina sp. B12 TaxID=2992757 RepID=UPI00237BC855|nr:hypothetical protein [Demequina sp. B12]MDE0571941.1 hypothetical protein [Demequina sp. B12]